MKTFEIRGSLPSALFVQLLISPLSAFGVYFLLNGVYFGAAFAVSIAAYAWLDVRTAKVTIEDEIFYIEHFFRKILRIKCKEILIKYGRGGDIGLLPVVVIYLPSSRKIVGNIKRTYFSQADVAKLISVAESAGAKLGKNISSP